jgi:hypothetical protein
VLSGDPPPRAHRFDRVPTNAASRPFNEK